MPKNPWSLPDFYDENVKKAFKEISAAFKNAKKSIPQEALDALQQGNWELFLSRINWQDISNNFSFLSSMVGTTATTAALSMYKKSGVGAKLTFDIIDAYSVRWASEHAGELVTNITNDMKLTIRRTITEATMGDITWQQAAEQIGEYIPLTSRDAQAVSAYHDRMLAKYIERKGWREKEARKYARNLANAYAEKLTQSRARTIARTEIANAATQGQYIGWQAGVESGMIDNSSVKEWIAEPTACEYCHEMDGKTVPWDQEFPILGGRLMPPAHPNCRCASAMLPPDYADSVFTSQALTKSKGWWNQFEIEYAKHLAGKNKLSDSSTLTKAITDYLQKSDDSYQPTQGMIAAAKRALRWKEEGKATGAGTPVGWGRATDIVSGRGMSLSVVTRMYSFFSRHEVDKKGKDFNNLSNPSNGRIMWDAWGGDAGFSWSKAIVERNKKLRKSNLRKNADHRKNTKLQINKFTSLESLDNLDPNFDFTKQIFFVKHLAGKHDQSTHGHGGSMKPVKFAGETPELLEYIKQNPQFAGFATPFNTRDEAFEFMKTQQQNLNLSDAQEEAIKEFTQGDYREINSVLRNNSMTPEAMTIREKTIKPLDAAIHSAGLEQDTVLVRGIAEQGDSDLIHNRYSALEVGDEWTETGFVSTSAYAKTAEMFASAESSYGFAPDGVIMHIKAPKGTPALAIHENHWDEYEFVMPLNQKFRVVGKVITGSTELMQDIGDNDGQKVTHLFVEAINP